ncbi:hypothetical protein [Hoeflea sp.]|uniref:hypothetical protein n=1 Tax=Hoeflea sp. TaxID=1940281 RepID=UPI0019B73EC7|nr:hypothetical protein [Hoeflea sp.]MBC7280014.1 hypothetical protein [Hoeflea sp.]
MSGTISDEAHFRLKAAQKDLVKHCGGGDRAGRLANYSGSQMGRFADTRVAPDLMPLHVALILEAECGVPYVTAAMAEINGHRLTAPAPEAVTGESVERDVFGCNTEMMRQAAVLAMAVADGLADGKLTPAELDKIARQTAPFRELMAKLDMALAKGRASGGQVVNFGGGAA